MFKFFKKKRVDEYQPIIETTIGEMERQSTNSKDETLSGVNDLTYQPNREVPRRTPLFQPNSYSALKPIIDELIQYKMILIDLSKLPEEDKKRTIDFLSGVTYALDGSHTKVENKVYKFVVNK